MSEIPTKPGVRYRVTPEDINATWELVHREDLDPTQDSDMAQILQDFADRRFPREASPWRPASEPPVVPSDGVLATVLAACVDLDGEEYLAVVEYGEETRWWSNPVVKWMPIPPHGEGGAE